MGLVEMGGRMDHDTTHTTGIYTQKKNPLVLVRGSGWCFVVGFGVWGIFLVWGVFWGVGWFVWCLFVWVFVWGFLGFGFFFGFFYRPENILNQEDP